jgi:hypothetical protein
VLCDKFTQQTHITDAFTFTPLTNSPLVTPLKSISHTLSDPQTILSRKSCHPSIKFITNSNSDAIKTVIDTINSSLPSLSHTSESRTAPTINTHTLPRVLTTHTSQTIIHYTLHQSHHHHNQHNTHKTFHTLPYHLLYQHVRDHIIPNSLTPSSHILFQHELVIKSTHHWLMPSSPHYLHIHNS